MKSMAAVSSITRRILYMIALRLRPRRKGGRESKHFEPLSRTTCLMGVSRAVNIGDLRTLAKRRLPRVVFDYIDGGADGEVTLRENCRIFDTVEFKPRNAVGGAQPDLATTVLGADLA